MTLLSLLLAFISSYLYCHAIIIIAVVIAVSIYITINIANIASYNHYCPW